MFGLKCSYQIVLVITIGYIGGFVSSVLALDDCKNSESTLLCHGTRVIRNVFKSMQNSNTPLTIVPGLEIVRVPSSTSSTSSTSSASSSSKSSTSSSINSINDSQKDINNKKLEFDGRSNDIEDDSFTGRISNYMQNHELKIKFSDLLDKSDFKDALLTTLKYMDDGKDVVEGRKKDKGGMGGIMIMGLMMGKMMAALGLGGVGALAMKALGVSMMALLLAGIIGIKKLAESSHDDGHHVQYITAHEGHHRKRREIDEDIPLPYRGWTQYSANYEKF